jgi:hypothetical protein
LLPEGSLIGAAPENRGYSGNRGKLVCFKMSEYSHPRTHADLARDLLCRGVINLNPVVGEASPQLLIVRTQGRPAPAASASRVP